MPKKWVGLLVLVVAAVLGGWLVSRWMESGGGQFFWGESRVVPVDRLELDDGVVYSKDMPYVGPNIEHGKNE